MAELVGPHTLGPVPEAGLLAGANHGVVRGKTVEEDVAGAREVLERLTEAGIAMHEITERRQVSEGVQLFLTSFEQLISAGDKKRAVEV
jgi:transaldolase